MMEGGASLAPKRCSFEEEAMEARNNPECSFKPCRMETKTSKNMSLSSGREVGSSKLSPVSVLKDQLQCFPLPLTPLKGFSWKIARKL